MKDLIDVGPAKSCSGIYLTSLPSHDTPAVRCHVEKKNLKWKAFYVQIHVINLPGLGHARNRWKCIACVQGITCAR